MTTLLRPNTTSLLTDKKNYHDGADDNDYDHDHEDDEDDEGTPSSTSLEKKRRHSNNGTCFITNKAVLGTFDQE